MKLIILDKTRHEREIGDDVWSLVSEKWEDSDKLLRGLQSHPLFEGKLFWCELTPTLLRILVAENLSVFVEKPFDEKVCASLDFLVGMLARKLETLTGSRIESMTLARHSHTDVRYQIALSGALDLPKPKLPRIRLIVDNTRT